jgi:hypothetical protein
MARYNSYIEIKSTDASKFRHLKSLKALDKMTFWRTYGMRRLFNPIDGHPGQ